MKNNILIGLIGISSACLFASCKADRPSMSNQEFITIASSNNNLEIMSADQAIAKGLNNIIVTYGYKMKTHYDLAGKELSDLARGKNWVLSQGMQKGHQLNFEMLSPFTGEEFDWIFAELMVHSQQEALGIFREAVSGRGVSDPDLRAWIGSKLPILEQHLKEALALRAGINKKILPRHVEFKEQEPVIW